MSAWRHVGIELLPEYRKLIETSDGPMMLWIELHLELDRLLGETPRQDAVIQHLFDYAKWCLHCPGQGEYLSDAGTAAVVAFYEHLPGLERRYWRELSRWFPREDFLNLTNAYRYRLNEAQLQEFIAEYLAGLRSPPQPPSTKWNRQR